MTSAGKHDAIARAAAIAAHGLRRRLSPGIADELARAVTSDSDPRVRAAALAALCRAGGVRRASVAWQAAARDHSSAVRRRACEIAPLLAARFTRASLVPALARLLADPLLADAEVTVVEAAAWALGELDGAALEVGAVPALAEVTTTHPDAIAREAAVAALGAVGDPAGLDAILAACRDKPTVRRRAVLALAPFEGPAVDAALQHAVGDRDWQVRQAAEDLLSR